jgi:gliding motility-associated-like protein
MQIAVFVWDFLDKLTNIMKMEKLMPASITAFTKCVLFVGIYIISIPFAHAQFAPILVNDTICIDQFDPLEYNVYDNDVFRDSIRGLECDTWDTSSQCFFIDPEGFVIFKDNRDKCCGDFLFTYGCYYKVGNELLYKRALVFITVKCGKPDCSVVDLSQPVVTEEEEDPVFYSCEKTDITYLLDYLPGSTYTWHTGDGAIVTDGKNEAEKIIRWDQSGANSITVKKQSGTTVSEETFQVEILKAPVADFQMQSSNVCKGGMINFSNTSKSATSYFWDFGNGKSSSEANPSVSYFTPGTYIVTLFAYNDHFTDSGRALCCCSDTIQKTIIVEPDSAPDIYCNAVVCEGDSAVYWTSAMNCNYNWLVKGPDGTLVPFSGQGTDTIKVFWPAGPTGIVILEVSNCSQPDFCLLPASLQVPIIPGVEKINGNNKVCRASTESYSMPKWPGVSYKWNVTGGLIISENGGHQVTVNWGTGSVGKISVTYFSSFLQGLPDDDDTDCFGSGELSVAIVSSFKIESHAKEVCEGSLLTLKVNQPTPLGFTWTITPDDGNVPFSGKNSIDVTWSRAGTYNICIRPSGVNDFCNEVYCSVVRVLSVLPPDSIKGPEFACPGEELRYQVANPVANADYFWEAENGVIIINAGFSVKVKWENNNLPGKLSVSRQMTSYPFCRSRVTMKTVSKKEFNAPQIELYDPACINQVNAYSITPVQYEGTTYDWKIVPDDMGSVFEGQGTADINVQWNNTSGVAEIQCNLMLCGETTTVKKTINTLAPVRPDLKLSNTLCSGKSAYLFIQGGVFQNILWSSGETNDSILVTSAAVYSVTTTDANKCSYVSSEIVNEAESPVASISADTYEKFCVTPLITTPKVNIKALINPDYRYEWFLDDISLGPASIDAEVTHLSTANPSEFDYYAKVTNIGTGCESISNHVYITQDDCTGGGSGTGGNCTLAPHSVTLDVQSDVPDCDRTIFKVTASSNVTLVAWNFRDSGNNNNEGTLDQAVHTYSQAGIYHAILFYQVPCLNTGLPNFTTFQPVKVEIPVSVSFGVELIKCREYKFENNASHLPGYPISSYYWEFGDGKISSDPDPAHVYENCGSYTVKLTVTTVNGCSVAYEEVINVPCDPLIQYDVVRSPSCEREPVKFTHLFPPGVRLFNWSFGNGIKSEAGSPYHNYSLSGNYKTALLVTDVRGCFSSIDVNHTVYPAFNAGNIQVLPGEIICSGETAILTAPSAIKYLWSGGQTTPSVSVSNAGKYRVTVSDNNGCSSVTPDVTIEVEPEIQAPVYGGNFICESGCVTVSTAMNSFYRYKWFGKNGNPLFGQSSSTISICENNFQDSIYVEITHSVTGCKTRSSWWKIKRASSPEVAIQVFSGGLCEGESNKLFAEVSPSSNINYLWSTGEKESGIIAVQRGDYRIYVTDTITGCKDEAFIRINPLPDLCAIPFGCYTVCNPDTICAPDGLSAYQWHYQNSPIPGAVNPCLIIDKSGSYKLFARNSFNCSALSKPLDLEVISCCNLTLDITTKAVTCAGGNDGEASVDIIFEGSPEAYDVYWRDEKGNRLPLNSSNIKNLITGEYSVEIITKSGCKSDIKTFVIKQPLANSINTEIISPLCFDDTGKVIVRVSGENKNFDFNWYIKNSDIIIHYDSVLVAKAGTYFLKVIQPNGCTDSLEVIIDQPDSLIVSAKEVSSPSCFGSSNGKIRINPTGGTPPYQTTWNTGRQGDFIDNLPVGIYEAVVRDANNCEVRISIELKQPPMIEITLNESESQEISCKTDQGSIALDIIGGSGSYSVDWGTGVNVDNGTAIGLSQGLYCATITDIAGCTEVFCKKLEPSYEIQVDLGEDIEVELGSSSGAIFATINSKDSIVNYSWTPNIFIDCITVDCDSVRVSPREPLEVILEVTDINGCKGRDTLLIKLIKKINVFFPNIFSPNNDGINDRFQITIGNGVEKINYFRIFDRWGNQVFTKLNFIPDPITSDSWDGTLNGNPLGSGVYIYTAEVLLINGEKSAVQGTITYLGRN